MAVNCNAPAAAQTNATSLSTCKVCEPVGGTVWKYWEPNEVSSFDASLTKEARDPISQNRGGGKSVVTALEAAPGFSHDLTVDFIDYYMDDFLFTTWAGIAARKFTLSAVTGTGYTVASGAVVPVGSIVYAAGFATAGNNGRKVVSGTPTATSVTAAGLTAEASPPAAAQLHVVGIEYAVGDVAIDADGNITTAAADFTTQGYVLNQWIDVRGFTTQTGSTLARVVGIAAGKLTLANSTLATEVGTGKTISIYHAQLARTVSATDPLFRQPQMTMELRHNSVTPEYEYARRAQANQIVLNLPVTAKATADVTFSAADVEAPSTTRKPGVWSNTLNNDSMAAAAGARRVSVEKADETGLSSYIKDVTITINNNGGSEAVWGDLTATFANYGNQAVTSATEAVFIDGSVLRAARNNDTVQLTLGLSNAQGVVIFHQPDSTWDDPAKVLNVNETTKVSGTITAFTDPLSYRFACSLFWWVPAV